MTKYTVKLLKKETVSTLFKNLSIIFSMSLQESNIFSVGRIFCVTENSNNSKPFALTSSSKKRSFFSHT